MPSFDGSHPLNTTDSRFDRPHPPFVLTRFLTDLTDESVRKTEVHSALGHLTEALAGPPEETRPFLSILMRTQGSRLEPFRDALLCLNAQTDQDFEVLVLVHDATPKAHSAVAQAVEEQHWQFRDKIRVVEVRGGSRGTPLNEGLKRAKGRFVAVYDDDDLVFAHWVEEFHRSSTQSEGRLLRAVTAVQSLSPETWPRGHGGFRTSSWPAAEHHVEFDLVEHFRVNRTPFMSFAFPVSIFSLLGLAFDEELDVCEDWDMILRASLLCGVTNVPALTAIYRRWASGNSSYLDHSTGVWAESEARVIRKVDSRPVLLPPGSIEIIRALLVDQEDYRRILNSRGWKLSQPLMRSLRIAARIRDYLRPMRERFRRRLASREGVR